MEFTSCGDAEFIEEIPNVTHRTKKYDGKKYNCYFAEVNKSDYKLHTDAMLNCDKCFLYTSDANLSENFKFIEYIPETDIKKHQLKILDYIKQEVKKIRVLIADKFKIERICIDFNLKPKVYKQTIDNIDFYLYTHTQYNGDIIDIKNHEVANIIHKLNYINHADFA